ncbi:MAG TPA: peptidylprolyl isomerase [Gammaproteobacteria bacterium]
MPKLLKDPLVHFLVLGALLFALSAWRGEVPSVGGGEPIVITAEQVEQVRQAATLLNGRPPTAEELEELIEPTIREEVYYREALALGLDENDDEVRRRLVEKMQYLTTDLADPEPATEEELRAFYEASPERFRRPEAVTFEQRYFSPSTRGDALQGDVEAALEALRGGADPASVGDRTPLRDRYDAAPREQVRVLFGEAMTDALFAAEPGQWVGPFASDFGLHVARVHERTASRIPPYEEIRAEVAETFAADRRERANAEEYARMRARYDVVIEWPEDLGGRQETE